MKQLAVILLNYNSSADCEKCIQQLKTQTGVEVVIIVVDNCSRMDERLAVEDLCQRENVVFLSSPENRGYSAGNNIGLRYAAKQGYDIAAICNPDMEFPQRDCLAQCLTKMQSDDEIAILAPDIVMSDGVTHQNPQQDGEDRFWPILLGPCYLFKGLLLQNLPKSYAESDWQTSRYCQKMVGCFFLIRLSFLESIGFLDEHTFLYCEEPILARQVRQAGMKLYYLAEAHAIHHHIKSTKGNPCRNMKLFQDSQLYLYQHYCGFNRWQFFWIFVTRKIGNFFWNLLLWLNYHYRR